jgi:diaminopimelate decarboxylase
MSAAPRPCSASGLAADPATTSLAEQLVEQWFGVDGSQLLIGGVAVSDIVQTYGTPLYVYDSSVMQRKWAAIRQSLPTSFGIYYSMKANPSQAILRFFLERDCGLEVASGGELYQALAAGCPAERILFAGPGKTDPELRFALESSVGEIHVESRHEIERLAAIAKEMSITPRIALRVNPDAASQGGAMRMGGRPAPFGVDEAQIDETLQAIARTGQMHVAGIHLFAGTQILDAQVLLSQYRHAMQIARRVADQLRRPLDTIDFGGGWGVPYFPHERPLDLQVLREGLEQLASEAAQDDRLRAAHLIVEPGRFLTAEAGIYITQVLDVKRSGDTTYVILNGGMHQHLAASGNLGQVIKRNYPIGVLNRMGALPEQPVELVGPLCTPLDTLGRNVILPQVEPGDCVGVFLSGAYARSASPMGFLSHATPAEVFIIDGRPHLIRRRRSWDDSLSDQTLPLRDPLPAHEL